jgi:hypothetical protein
MDQTRNSYRSRPQGKTGDGREARALASLGITEAAATQQIREIVTPGPPLPPLVQIPFSAPAKQALEVPTTTPIRSATPKPILATYCSA